MKEYIEKITNDYFKDKNNTNRMGLGLLIFLIIFSGSIIFLGGYLAHVEKTEVFVICMIFTIIILPAINFFQLSFTPWLKKNEEKGKLIYVYYIIVLFSFFITTIIYMFVYQNDSKMFVLYWIWISSILMDLILAVLDLNEKKMRYI